MEKKLLVSLITVFMMFSMVVVVNAATMAHKGEVNGQAALPNGLKVYFAGYDDSSIVMVPNEKVAAMQKELSEKAGTPVYVPINMDNTENKIESNFSVVDYATLQSKDGNADTLTAQLMFDHNGDLALVIKYVSGASTLPTPIDIGNDTDVADILPQITDPTIYNKGHIVSVDQLPEKFEVNGKSVPMYRVNYRLDQFAMKMEDPYTKGFLSRQLSPYLKNVSYSVDASEEKPLYLGTVKNTSGDILKGVSIKGSGRFTIDSNGVITVADGSMISSK